MSRHKKHLDFEFNLVPFIDLLSVCICFLLITAVWIQVGSLNTKQAVGGQPAGETAKQPTVWFMPQGNGDVIVDVKDSRVPSKLSKQRISSVEGKFDFEKLSQALAQLRGFEPGLLTALIQPQASTLYEDIIGLMDSAKKSGIVNLGVSPL